jgi:hypothetical protein
LAITWWIVGGLICVIALWKLLSAQPFGRNKTKTDISHGIRSLAVLGGDGSYLTIKQRQSLINLRVTRLGDDEKNVELVVSVPQEPWAEPHLQAIQDLLERQGHRYSQTAGCLVEVPIVVADIWDEAVGAKAARLCNLLLNLFDPSSQPRFDFRIEGRHKLRKMSANK